MPNFFLHSRGTFCTCLFIFERSLHFIPFRHFRQHSNFVESSKSNKFLLRFFVFFYLASKSSAQRRKKGCAKFLSRHVEFLGTHDTEKLMVWVSGIGSLARTRVTGLEEF
jgi:hypothetical protein